MHALAPHPDPEVLKERSGVIDRLISAALIELEKLPPHERRSEVGWLLMGALAQAEGWSHTGEIDALPTDFKALGRARKVISRYV